MNKFKKSAYISLGSLTLFASSANAALPAEASDALAKVGTAITDSAAAVWPYIGAFLGASMLIKIVKRFANKI